MPHRIRRDHPRGVFHLTGRVNWQVWHLEKPGASELFLAVLSAQLERFAVNLIAFVVMSNHYHLVVQSPAEAQFSALTSRVTPCRHRRPWPKNHYKSSVIAQCMKGLLQAISTRVQAELGVTGSFWDGRYHDRELLDPGKLVVSVAYDHRNPVRAGMVTRAEQHALSSAQWWREQRSATIPLLAQGPLPFEVSHEAFRAELIRYEDHHAFDDAVAAWKKKSRRWGSRAGERAWLQISADFGLPSPFAQCGTSAAPQSR